MKMHPFLLAMIASLIILAGCSSSGNPVAPQGTGFEVDSVTSTPVGVTDRLPDGTPSQGVGVLGLYSLQIDASHKNVDLVPLRKTAITDVLESVDITNFMKLAPCSDCVILKSMSSTPEGYLSLNIGVKHPFPKGDPYAPPSGKNRGDLHVFNVEGTIISSLPGESFAREGQAVAGFSLVNADGYSGYQDSALDTIFPTEATIHPYILHFDDYSAGNFAPTNPMGFQSVTTPPPSGNLVMPMGSDFDYQDYVFDLPDGTPVEFIYAVECTYAVAAAGKAQRFTPEYRVPQHNKKAASEVKTEVLNNGLMVGNTASTAEIEISVVDISHNVAVGTALNEMYADSSVAEVRVDIPGIMTDELIIDGSASISGTGHDPANALIYNATITNSADCPGGVVRGLIKVQDSYSAGLNQSSLLNGMDGIKRVDPSMNPLEGLFTITEFATYAVFSLEVLAFNEDPIAILLPDPVEADLNFGVDYDATTSSDPDGTITLYEFDYIWDGIEANFAADDSNTTGLIFSDPYTQIGTFTAGLRVTDNRGAVAYDSVVVDVKPSIYVDNSYTGSIHDGSKQHPFLTITEGVNAASAGYVVKVDDSGTPYTEKVTMKSDITVSSVNWDTTDGGPRAFIDAIDTDAAALTNSTVLFNQVSNATITGFKIGYASYWAAGRVHMVYIDGGTGNTVRNCYFTGIAPDTPTYHVLILRVIDCLNTNNVTIENNEMSEIDSNALYVRYFYGVYAINAPGFTMKNNVVSEIRSTSDTQMKNVYSLYITNTNGVTVKNNLMSNVIPHAQTNNSVFIEGYHILSCTNISVTNNTVDNLVANDAFFIQQVFAYWFESCTTITFRNNIASHLHADNSFPPGLARAVTSVPDILVCDYMCIYDVATPFYNASGGTGYITGDPMYIDAPNNNYEIDAASPAQAGDTSILDWDDDNSGGNESRSRMGCKGGPGGEFVGLLTGI